MFLAKNKKGVLEEAHRLLKKGGFLVIIDWRQNLGSVGPVPEQMVASEAVIALGEQVGFALTDQFGEGEYHYCLIFKKM
jgi:ubiquinone/menaquinone biosynthesis C-methylase UbiE